MLFVSGFLTPDSMFEHMAVHIFIMSVIAPAIVLIWYPQVNSQGNNFLSRNICLSTSVQIGTFTLWHSPLLMQSASNSSFIWLIMNASLFAVAVWFWLAVRANAYQHPCRSIFSLLVTGKIFCLIAALQLFSPRHLVAGFELPGDTNFSALMADQQLAGLLMLAACPLFYLGSAMTIAARWFYRLSAQQHPGAGNSLN